MGIERGLIYKKGDTFFLNTNKKGEIFDEIVFTDNFGFSSRKIFDIIVKKIYSY